MLIIDKLNKSYKQGKESVEILREVCLEIPEGTFAAITGSSGSGKSTLLHIAGLLDSPDSGTIQICGNTICSSDNIRTLTRLKQIGFVYQHHRLLSNFSAIENVALPMLIAKINRQEALKKSEKLLSALGLDNKKYNMPGELSGGEQQRVSIARSLANDPKILLADEPTGNLDPNTSEAVFNMFMKAVKSRNLTVLMVTHNLDMAKLAHRSYTLSNGKLLTSSS